MATSEEAPMTSAGTILMMLAGIVLAGIGIIKGFLNVGYLCGSPFRPDSLAAELYDTLEGSYGGATSNCEKALSASMLWVVVLICLGVVLFAVGMIMRTITKNRVTGAQGALPPTVVKQSPGIGSQVEDLGRLRDQGLITAEEYESKKTDLLSRL